MAWSGERRKHLPSDWPKLRAAVLKRDGYRCQWRMPDGQICAAPANQADHVVRGNDHRLQNLQSLCEPHHAQKSAREGGAERARLIAANKRRFRRTEAHPGLLDPG